MKRYSILVDTNRASQTTRIQLRDGRGCRPGTRPAIEHRRPARKFVDYFEANEAVQGMRFFTFLREELEMEVN